MSKIWLLASMTYRKGVRSGTFLLLTLGMPVIMVIVGAIIVLSNQGGDLPQVGYVDQTRRLAEVTQVSSGDDTLTLRPHADTASALAAFRRGEIGGYLVVPEGYFEGQPATYYGESAPSASLSAALEAFMRRAILAGEPASMAGSPPGMAGSPDWLVERLAKPAAVTYTAREGNVEIPDGPAMLVYFVFPAILAALIGLAMFTGASQMGLAIVREKQQRAMEIVITSLTPLQLVAGKILGMTLLSLTQLGIWGLGLGVAAGMALSSAGALHAIVIPWRPCVWALLLGVPGYFLVAVLSSGLGVMAGDSQQAQQFAGMLGFVCLAPLYALPLVMGAPNGPLAVGLTLFPLTAPVFALLRMVLAEVPAWQLWGSLAILVASLAGSIWLVARIFRATMLMYGRSLRPRHIWQALSQA